MADKKKLEFAVGNSDHLTMLKAYQVIMQKENIPSENFHHFPGTCVIQIWRHSTLFVVACLSSQLPVLQL